MARIRVIFGPIRPAHGPWRCVCYTGLWTQGAPDVDRLILTVAPLTLALILWVLARRRWAVLGFVLSALLTTATIIDDYLPAASESWSQRTALRHYFDERGPDDRLISWRFYHRGETFLTKANIWILYKPNRRAVADYITKREGMNAHLWFITTTSLASRLPADLPPKYRANIEGRYRNSHHVLLRVHIP
jgi:hypothetical protein